MSNKKQLKKRNDQIKNLEQQAQHIDKMLRKISEPHASSITDVQKEVRRVIDSYTANKSGMYANSSEAIEVLGGLATQGMESVARWMATVLDCEKYAYPIPASQTVGDVPVTLWRKTVWGEPISNPSGKMFAFSAADGWEMAGEWPILGQLEPGYSGGTVATWTNASMVGSPTVTPTQGVADPAGFEGTLLGFVSDEFKAEAVGPPRVDGTNYIMVAQKASLSLVSHNAAADGYQGRITVFTTLDPAAAPIMGQNISDMKYVASMQGSVINMAQFNITEDGNFIPVGLDEEIARVGDTEGIVFPEISSVSLPLDDGCYEWRKMGTFAVQGAGYTISGANIMFVLEGGPAGGAMTFSHRVTNLYQTERFTTFQVQPGANYQVEAHAGIGEDPFDSEFLLHPKNIARTKKATSSKVFAKPRKGARQSIAPAPRPPRRIDKRPPLRAPGTTSKVGPNEGAGALVASPARGKALQMPPQVAYLRQAVTLRTGRPLPMVLAPLAVISHACATVPGFHASMLKSGPKSIGTLIDPRNQDVWNHVAKHGANSAVAFADRMNQGEEAGSSFMSSVWDFVKGIAPELLGALIAL